MKKINIMALAAAFSLGGIAWAQETAPDMTETAPAIEEALDEPEFNYVSADFSLPFHSRYIIYGMVHGKGPVIKPNAQITFFDTLYFGILAQYDLTGGNGRRRGYGNRAGKWRLLDNTVGLKHDFDLGDTLGDLTVDVNYIYERIHRYWDPARGKKTMGDTQYVNLELALNDLWLEPKLAIERDIMDDNGTYANFSVGHKFGLCENVTLRPSVAQGLGNTQRTRGYMSMGKYAGGDGFSHGGLMDTSLKLTAEWAICDHLSLSGYVAYYDYIFDSTMRSGARARNRVISGGRADTAQFVGGLAINASF